MIGEFVKLRREWTAEMPGANEFHRIPPGTTMLVYQTSGSLLRGIVAHGVYRNYDVSPIGVSEVVPASPQEVLARRAEEN